MKTQFTTLFLLGLFFAIINPGNTFAATVESVPGGTGNWSDGSTWVGGFAPNPGDDIIINGMVFFNTSTTVNNITINPAGTLLPLGSTRTLNITGDITNDGKIQNNTFALHFNIEGDIYHDGLLWANGNTVLTGTSDQEVWSSGPFAGNGFSSIVSTRDIIITSDIISFENCNVDLNDANVVFGNGQLFLTGGYITDMMITADQLDITLNDGAYLDDFTCSANYVWLRDLVNIQTDVLFEGNTTDITVEVVDTLQNTSGSTRLLTVDGNLHNSGVIRNNVYNLNINLSGSLVNSGTWENYNTNLIGNSNQFITHNKEFAGATFTSNMAEGGIATALSALRFIGTNIDFNDDSLYMNVGNDSIFINGGYMYDISIIANAAPWQVYCHQMNGSHYDDVLLEGEDVVLDGTFDFITSFNIKGNARVEGIFQNKNTSTQTAYVTGNLTNNGTIQDNTYGCYVNVGGDIYQNGTWTNDYTNLDGVGDQSLTFTKPFGGEHFQSLKPSGKAISQSTLSFINTTIDFNYDTLLFAAGADSLITSGNYLQEMVIIKASAKTAGFLNVSHYNDAYFHDVIIEGNTIDLNGTFQYTQPMEFNGNVVVEGILQNRPSSSYTAYIKGDLTNNGEISNNTYNCYLNVSGDIYQNGIWTNSNVSLDGDSDQHFAFTTTFEAESLTNLKTGGKVIANTSLSFNNTLIDFNYDTLLFAAGADSLLLSQKFFQEAVIMKESAKTAGFLNISHSNSAYMHDMIIESSTIDLNGTFQYTSPMEFNGHVIVEGILQNYPSSNYNATINGDVTNNGTIGNMTYNNTLYITGNIAQNGVWSNYYNYLTGTSTQHLSATNPFTCYRIIDNDPASGLQADSDLGFENTDVDLNGADLTISGDYMLSITDSWFIVANIMSNKCGVTMHGDSYFQNVSLENASLYDWVKVRSGCSFSGKTVVVDTLSPYPNINPTVVIDGDITNNGVIKNHIYNLYLQVSGNMINNGLWTNVSTILNGTPDQSIYLLNGQEIAGQVFFDALGGGSPYQWYYEGGILDDVDFSGETNNSLAWQVPVSPTWYGDFYCQTGAGQSRTITVEGGLIFDLAVMLEGPFNGTDMNTTLNNGGLIPLAQPYNTAPWNYSGTETVATIPTDVVDWVLVEFRETSGGAGTATSGTAFATGAFFLRNDGQIVTLDGSPEIRMETPIINDNLYVVVYHRNHLGVISANPVSFDVAPLPYDFSTGESQAYGDAHKDLGSGVYGMYAANADSDNDVDN
ncbi:MAG: hypothetical protein KDC05_14905, partial [Bacteroidales bacterium]|nr:hypothetical protein [Bacteroidales bacterium]